MSEMASIYQFKVEGIDGNEIRFEDFKGKKILVVNVASQCGYTPQYQQLEELYKEFKNKMIIIGFPSNDFGGQEPGTNAEIKTFCTLNYDISFPMAAKVKINEHPVYQWLTKKTLNDKLDSQVAWNFQKYLISENGQLVTFYPSSVDPLDEKIIDWILS
ncbi:MAG: glutathione peroxidase [Saprospiraceae bacterium]|jgi:glutathione peroxidase